MDRYYSVAAYAYLRVVVSASVVLLQLAALTLVPWGSLTLATLALGFLAAYLLADFLNGVVHMVMDNTDAYGGVIGPLVAVFHLHHKTPRYQDSSPAAIYVLESGSKHWLVPYLCVLVYAQAQGSLPGGVSLVLTLVGVLSSVAEVSHYLCHNSTHPLVRALQRVRLLLPPEHHAVHHSRDNVRYAFLNGITDPLIDAIAKRSCGGYVGRVDLHVQKYRKLSRVGPHSHLPSLHGTHTVRERMHRGDRRPHDRAAGSQQTHG